MILLSRLWTYCLDEKRLLYVLSVSSSHFIEKVRENATEVSKRDFFSSDLVHAERFIFFSKKNKICVRNTENRLSLLYSRGIYFSGSLQNMNGKTVLKGVYRADAWHRNFATLLLLFVSFCMILGAGLFSSMVISGELSSSEDIYLRLILFVVFPLAIPVYKFFYKFIYIIPDRKNYISVIKFLELTTGSSD